MNFSQPAPGFVCSCGREFYAYQVEAHEIGNPGHVVLDRNSDRNLKKQERIAYDAGEIDL